MMMEKKMGKYKLVIFDMDGTLADTSPGILNSIRYVQNKMKLPEISLEQMYSHVGPPIEESYRRNFGLEGDRLAKAISLHKKYALAQGYKEIQWYNGIVELLNQLKNSGFIIAIATLKSYGTMMKIIDNFDMSDKFDIITGVTGKNLVNKTQLLKYCIETAKIKKEDAVLVGDSKYDALGAVEAGIDFIAVTYGFGFKNKDDVSNYKHTKVCNNVFSILDAVN